MRNEGIVLDHSTIYERIWGYDFGADSKNLAVYVGYLRRKLDAAGAPALIHTVRGVGYTLRQAVSLRTRFALAFAARRAVVVAGWSGVLSYHAAADRITSRDRPHPAVGHHGAGRRPGRRADPVAAGHARPRPWRRTRPSRRRWQRAARRAGGRADGTVTPLGGRAGRAAR